MIIITKAKDEMMKGLRKKGNGNYYEAHHTLPKSLFPLWSNRKSNIVLLTAREHYFCHELLIKIYPGRSMNYALWILSNSKYHNISSRQYERARLLNYQNSLGESNPNFGNKWTDEQKKAASDKTKEQLKRFGNPNSGNKWSDTQKQSLSEKMKGRKFFTNGVETICVIPGDEPEGFYLGHSSSFSAKTEEGKKSRADALRKIRHDYCTGRKWYHNAEGKNIMAFEKPEGFVEGKYISEEKLLELKEKVSVANKGQTAWNLGKRYSLPKQPGFHWYTNGVVNTRAKECPEGFWPGMTKNS